MDSSYRRYRQYQANRQQYKVDQLAVPIVVMLILGFVTNYGWIVSAVLIGLCVLGHNEVDTKKKNRIKQEENKHFQKEDTVIMNTSEVGYINRNNQKNNGKTDIPGTDFGQWFYDMECLNCGHTYHANGSNIYEKKCPKCQESKGTAKSVSNGKSTEVGYINKNNQRNNGKTDMPGTGYGQWFYDMECLNCGHKYHANGHDVWLRKCPNCQGGR